MRLHKTPLQTRKIAGIAAQSLGLPSRLGMSQIILNPLVDLILREDEELILSIVGDKRQHVEKPVAFLLLAHRPEVRPVLSLHVYEELNAAGADDHEIHGWMVSHRKRNFVAALT